MVAPTAKKGDVLQMSPEAHETHAALDGSDGKFFGLFVSLLTIQSNKALHLPTFHVFLGFSFRLASVQLPG
jgi:hypothetical protein